jgi:NADPH:quinone reductase-like Zn-dependent oxidoreductase
VAVGEGAAAAREYGPFDLILDSLGDGPLGEAMGMISPRGTCVAFGPSAGTEVRFDVSGFYAVGGATLYGFILFHEVLSKPASDGLSRLARLVAEGRLNPRISVEEPWTEVGNVAQRLLDRSYPGKAVLRVG